MSTPTENQCTTKTPEELYDLFYVAAYGCNRQCEVEIRKVFHAHRNNVPVFAFFEFFTTHPIPQRIENCDDEMKRIFLLTPFAPRLAQHSNLAPVFNPNTGRVELQFRTAQLFREEMMLALRMDKSDLNKQALELWRGGRIDALSSSVVDKGKAAWQSVIDRNTGAAYQFGFIDNYDWNYQNDGYIDLMDEPISHAYAQAVAKLTQSLFLDNENKNVPGVMVPIASSRHFYGTVWISFPGLSIFSESDKALRMAVAQCVAQLIEKTYLPVLTLLHEYWLENLYAKAPHAPNESLCKQFKAVMKKPQENGEEQTVVFRNVYLEPLEPLVHNSKRKHGEIADEIEVLLYELWKRRDVGGAWAWHNNGEKFRESLVFRKYLICSASMVSLLYDVITAAKYLAKSNDTLPACLVVGGPGSGKEKLASMIRLFSRDNLAGGYYKGEEYVVNLASIRPAPITAAVMVGIEMKSPSNNAASGKSAGTFQLDITGILQRIREVAHDSPPTLRLDEFNSMDPDSQGVLLRYLDNSEIVAVGGLKDPLDKEKTNCLVVGIMNEDPEEISRERAMEFLRSPYLGGLLSDLLYEHFMHIRRLRPDVMYRMVRNGKFVIPALNKRREDIPLLFHVFVVEELKGVLKGQERTDAETIRLRITLDALDKLVSTDLAWPGNIRQLQALAKVVAEKLLRQPENHDSQSSHNGSYNYVVCESVLSGALETEMPIPNPSLSC